MRISDVAALLMTSSEPWTFRIGSDGAADDPRRGRARGGTSWTTSTCAHQWPCADGSRRMVHRGMAMRARRMQDASVRFCKDHLAPGESVVLAGWSLGGGTIICLAAQLASRGIPVDSVHVLGTPRLGNARFAAWYDDLSGLGKKTTRYATPCDPVPWLPHTLYRHLGHRYEIVPCERKNPIRHHDLAAYVEGFYRARDASLYEDDPHIS